MAGPTKIGVAHDLDARRDQLQTGHFHRLCLVGKWWFVNRRTAVQVEQWALREVGSARLHGEWIGLAADEVTPIIDRYIERHIQPRFVKKQETP